MFKLEDLKKQVENFLTVTEDARFLSQRDRDYKDNKQWTDAEVAKLNSRNQAPIVVNRIKPKVEGLKGLLIQRKTDPKAWPRTQKHEKTAEALTDGLRYVADNVDFDQVKLDVADNIFVEGYGAAVIEVEPRGDDVEVTIVQIPWDRYFYDIHSRRLDFADKMYDGIVLWMDEEDFKDQFGKPREGELVNKEDGQETFDDRPQFGEVWYDKKRKRIRVVQHFYRKKDIWYMCIYTCERFLQKPVPSPYLDEFGTPTNPIEAQAANIDRENNRFGEVRYWIDQQDEINHRRSKFLHYLNYRQTIAKRGAIDDVPALKRESSKADGHIEYNGEKGDLEFLPTGEMRDGQYLLYEDGKRELDAVGFNAQLSGERQGDLSGRAISNLQNAAINELSSLYSGISSWEKRVYRQVWMRMKQFWDSEKWIRVTDDHQKLRWVGFNQQVTLQQLLQEQAEDESLDLQARQEAGLMIQQLQQANPQALQQIQETRNDIAELDVDILIDVSLDTMNVQQEQFEMLANIAQTRPEVPFEQIVELSNLRTKQKDKIVESIRAGNQAAQEQAQAAQQIEAQEKQAKAAEKMASAQKKTVEAEQTQVQTELLITEGTKDPAVII